MKRSRLIAATAVAASLALVATGCAATGGDEGSSDEPVTITFWGSYGNGGNSAQQDVLNDTLIPAFEAEHPNITVQYVDVPYDDLLQKLTTSAAGDALPDLVRADLGWVPRFASSVRPTTRIACAWSTPEMYTFCPDRIQSLPSRRAVVVMRCELEPASGSVIAKAIVIEPSAIPGIQRFFWSSVPNLLMMVPLMAGETTIISSGQPPADISSITIDNSYMPAPPPPYSSGRLTPMKPSLPASDHSSSV